MFRAIGGVLALLTLTLAVGCAKKAEKYTRRSDDSAASPASDKLKTADAKKANDPEKPSWLKPRPEDGELPVSGSSTGKPPWVQTPPAVPPPGQLPLPAQPMPPGGQPTPATPAPAGIPQPAAPTPQPATVTPTGTSGKKVTKADMHEVWIFVENFSQANVGKMPRPELTFAALVKAGSPAADLVKSSDIILTGATTRESVWAYERNAPTKGGWIATQNGAEEVSAAEFAKRIKQ